MGMEKEGDKEAFIDCIVQIEHGAPQSANNNEAVYRHIDGEIEQLRIEIGFHGWNVP